MCLNLQEDSFTDGSGQNDLLSSSSSMSSGLSSSSDGYSSNKSLLPPPGMPSFLPDFHTTQVLCKLVNGSIYSFYCICLIRCCSHLVVAVEQ